jgi:chorismate synthase
MRKLRWLTAGESHGKGLVGILEGLPAGLEIHEDYITQQLLRRQMGFGRGKRMEIEDDRAEIYAGVRYGKTIGSPIALLISNKDSDNWKHQMSISLGEKKTDPVTLPRPGHGDLAGIKKFGLTDIRDIIERASARETAMRVALGSLARKLLAELNIEVGSRVTRINTVQDNTGLPMDMTANALNVRADKSPLRCLDKQTEKEMQAVIEQAKTGRDTVGGIFEVLATGIPYGLGSHIQWDLKLKARLSQAIFSINAIKGIEVGLGFSGAQRRGSEFQDEIIKDKAGNIIRTSNNAGGIEAGISNAQPIVIRAVMKPLPTLRKPLRSVDIQSGKLGEAHKERTDTCAVPAASIVAESMVCLVLADAMLEKFGGDSLHQTIAHVNVTAQY